MKISESQFFNYLGTNTHSCFLTLHIKWIENQLQATLTACAGSETKENLLYCFSYTPRDVMLAIYKAYNLFVHKCVWVTNGVNFITLYYIATQIPEALYFPFTTDDFCVKNCHFNLFLSMIFVFYTILLESLYSLKLRKHPG